MNPESELKSKTQLLKQPDDKRYLPLKETLELLDTVPIPEDDENNSVAETPSQDENPAVDLDNMIIQLNNFRGDNGSKKNQDDWIDYWNNFAGSSIFPSMSDYYRVFKQLKENSDRGSVEEKQKVQYMISVLRKDFEFGGGVYGLISSTRIKYGHNRNARIIHHYNCKNTQLIQQYDLLIPECEGLLIKDVLNYEEVLVYLQTLLGTKDDKELIMQTLELIRGKTRYEIAIWTPPLISNVEITRAQRPESVICFIDGGLGFLGEYSLLDKGYSRGAHIINKNPGDAK